MADNPAFVPDKLEQVHRRELDELCSLLADGEPAAVLEHTRRRACQLRREGIQCAEFVASSQLLGAACLTVLRATEDAGEALKTLETIERVRLVVYARACPQHLAGRSCGLDQPSTLGQRHGLCGLVGGSTAMQQVYEQLQVAARTRATVLLVGESGTGKELAAQALHRLSSERLGRFIPVNCAALPRDLMESELFGHLRGAFSGAGADKEGLFQAAHRGTLFLDEITELSPPAQAKLLRPLQEGRVRPLGGTDEVAVDVRVVASTNVALTELRESGRLRRDLYYRLQGFVIAMPPLRDRLDDVPLLVEHFLAENDNAHRRVTESGLAWLAQQRWPGNARELRTVIERACAVNTSAPITEADFAVSEGPSQSPPRAQSSEGGVSLVEVERHTIVRAMNLCGGNKAHAARVLGISRKQLYVKLDRLAIEKTDGSWS